jgi:hypothetical protein
MDKSEIDYRYVNLDSCFKNVREIRFTKFYKMSLWVRFLYFIGARKNPIRIKVVDKFSKY